ncbi:hypothetical protein HAX54_029847, partial [Datura stramonium]|nr:hypothetical protein [Datura stramonium]
MGLVATSSPSIQPPSPSSQPATAHGKGKRGEASGLWMAQNRFYALGGRHDQESAPDVIT